MSTNLRHGLTDVKSAARALEIDPHNIYMAIYRRSLGAVKRGRRWWIRWYEIERYAARRPGKTSERNAKAR